MSREPKYARRLRRLRVFRRAVWPEPPAAWHFVDVPVIDGIAILPDGRTTRSSSQIVRVPVLDPYRA